jgi:hypothetical protein
VTPSVTLYTSLDEGYAGYSQIYLQQHGLVSTEVDEVDSHPVHVIPPACLMDLDNSDSVTLFVLSSYLASLSHESVLILDL